MSIILIKKRGIAEMIVLARGYDRCSLKKVIINKEKLPDQILLLFSQKNVVC